MAMSLRSAKESMALAVASRVATVSGSPETDAREHLAAIGTERFQRGRSMTGEAVIELVDQAGQATAVHGTEDELAFQGTQEQEVVHDVRRGQDAIDGGVRQGNLQTVQEVPAISHGHRLRTNGEGAAGRMVRCDDEVLRAVLQAGCLRRVAAARATASGSSNLTRLKCS